MKRMIILILLALILMLSACAANKADGFEIETNLQTKTTEMNLQGTEKETEQTATETVTENNLGSQEITEYEEITTDSTVDAPSGIGGTDYCHVHYDSYHWLGGELSSYVGSDKVSEWLKTLKTDETKMGSETECPFEYNIKLLIDEFELKKEEFTEICNLTSHSSHNIDLLYSGTEAEIDAYYRDIDERIKDMYRSGHYNKIYDEIRRAYPEEVKELERVGDLYFARTVPEVVVLLDIDREEFQGYIDNATERCIEVWGVCYTFDYDLDMLYGTDNLQSTTMNLTPQSSIMSVNNDSDPNNDLSSNELDEMFCRVGRHAE